MSCFRYIADAEDFYQTYIVIDKNVEDHCDMYWRCRNGKELAYMNRVNRQKGGPRVGLFDVFGLARDYAKAKKLLASKKIDVEKAKKLIEKIKKFVDYLYELKDKLQDLISEVKEILKKLKEVKED